MVLAVLLLLSAGCAYRRVCDAGHREAAAWLDANALPKESVAADREAAGCFGERPVHPLPATTDSLELLRAVEGGQPDFALAASSVAWDGASAQPWFLERYRPVRAWGRGDAQAGTLVLYEYTPSPFGDGAKHKPPAHFLSDAVVLRGYRLDSGRVGPEDPIYLTLLWDDAPGHPYEGLRVAVRLAEVATGEIWAQSSARLAPLGVALEDDARLAQHVLLDPPGDLPRGSFCVLVSLTEASGRTVEVSDDAVAFDGGMVLATAVHPPDVSDDPIAMDHATAYGFESATGGTRIALLGYDAPERAAPGEWVRVALLWSSSTPVTEDYHVLVHLVSPDGGLVAQGDGVPVYGFLPTSTWDAGTYVRDEHGFRLPDDLPRGDYGIYVGLYLVESDERLVALDESGASFPDGRVALALMKVR
jgi:hypothetical protein